MEKQIVIHIQEEILNAEQVAEIFGSSKAMVERKLRAGEIVGVKRFGKWFVLRSDLIEYIEAGKK